MEREGEQRKSNSRRAQRRIEKTVVSAFQNLVAEHQERQELLDAHVQGYDQEKRTIPLVRWESGDLKKDISAATLIKGGIVIFGEAYSFRDQKDADGETVTVTRVKFTRGEEVMPPLRKKKIQNAAEVIFQQINPVQEMDVPIHDIIKNHKSILKEEKS